MKNLLLFICIVSAWVYGDCYHILPTRISLISRKHKTTSTSLSMSTNHVNQWMKSSLMTVAITASTLFGPINPNLDIANAADTAKVGLCLLQSCQKELLKCVLNPKCFANVICLNTCNGRPDESECEVKCGDLFENEVVGEFNTCAVSQKKCVPRQYTPDLYPMPDPASLVKKLDTKLWNGRWYISAGLNKAFDTFDCQVHFFDSPSPGKVYGKINWRVTEPDDEFFSKSTVQKFIQDPENPAHLYNHDNEYLHYKDDWYIIDYEPDDFFLVYYRGSNDAWDGYGGAFLYTRDSTVRQDLIPRLEKAVDSMKTQYKWSDFVITDNSCKPQTESATILREKYASKLFLLEEQKIQEELTSIRNAAINTIVNEEKEAEKSIQYLEKEFEAFQNEIVKDTKSIVSTAEKTLKVQ